MDRAFASAFSLFYFYFFSRVFELFECCGYCLCTVQWTITANFDFSNLFKPITAHHVLFTDPQISLFSNFFIKNGSHGIIHTFKNYFTIVFLVFSKIICIQMDQLHNFSHKSGRRYCAFAFHNSRFLLLSSSSSSFFLAVVVDFSTVNSVRVHYLRDP